VADKTRLSKFMSYVLRHGPGEYGLSLDRHGFVKMEKLLAVLSKKFPGSTEDDVHDVVFNSPKRRFEIKDGMIRAAYGHSVDVDLGLPAVEPPELLFHGTPRGSVKRILKEGLRSMSRKYVHLSVNQDDAKQVGRRRGRNPAVLKIRAKQAWQKGTKFYRSGNMFLAEHVDGKFLSGPSFPG
jgi:putative RNA 2'-phosphotransferase